MKKNKLTVYFLALSAFLMWTAPSFAKTYDLLADVTTKTMPDGKVITMWGFADVTPGTGDGIVTVPGPVLEVPAGDTTLTINLSNNLTAVNTGLGNPYPVSIVIPGQTAALSPAYFSPADPIPHPPEFDGRVRSLTYETMPEQTGVYTWTNLKPGTYIYHSGVHLQCHVQMGLYGAAKVYAPDGNVYPGVLTDAEFLFLYSEIDPAFHEAVSTGQYGPGTPMTSTINYKPKYFLINGEPYTAGQLFQNITAANQAVLIRLVNAGLDTHVPLLQDNYMNVIAENGNPYTYPREQYEVLLPAISTADAIFTPDQNGIFALYDRMLSLTNANVSGGGMLVRFNVGGVQ